MCKKIKQFLTTDTKDPRMARAQIRALSRQLPLTYMVLISATWAGVYPQIGVSPFWLTLPFPIFVSLFGPYRSYKWLTLKQDTCTDEEILKLHTTLDPLIVGIVAAWAVWVFALFSYGDAYQKPHLAFLTALAVAVCSFSLTSLPRTAKAVVVIAHADFLLFYVFLEGTSLPLGTLSIALSCVSMLIIMHMNYMNFLGMIEEQNRAESLIGEVEFLALTDNLTKLPNRRSFYRDLKDVFGKRQHDPVDFAVGILDLDGFKPINDIYGHLIGDMLLVALSDRLVSEIAKIEDVSFFRLGGDEFAFIAYDIQDFDQMAAMGDRFCEILARPFKIDGLLLNVTVTIGIAPKDAAVDAEVDLMERADHALYKGKRVKRDCCHVYSSEQEGDLRRKATITLALKSKELDLEIFPVFQPIVDIFSNRVVGMETLARWQHPQIGLVQPDEFIPIAEQAGHIGRITCIMLEKALAEAVGWNSDLRLSINLSAHDISSEAVLENLLDTIEKTGFPPTRIDFEITETAIIADMAQAYSVIDKLQEMGCTLSLDDFGTGYSNLSRLHALYLNTIKIDRSLVAGVQVGEVNHTMIASLFFYAQKRQLDCIAEGVETQSELDALRDLGIRYVQGYYFSRPIEGSEVSRTLERIEGERLAS